jgi:uncharacterized protein (DUF1800 family)
VPALWKQNQARSRRELTAAQLERAGLTRGPNREIGSSWSATTRTMRSAASAAQVVATAPLTPPARLGVLALTRAGFGLRPGELDAFEALAGDDDARLAAWVDQQLDPASIDDTECDNRIAAAGYTTLGKSLAQLWADHVVADVEWYERIRPIDETTLATFLRAVYSQRQLVQVLADFWHNHFNVYGWDSYAAPTWAFWDRDVIRAHLLGNFRQMLEAVAKGAPMLFYLDNWQSSVDGPNENYPREFLELHTIGSEHYYGVIPANQVPLDSEGRPAGFVDEDVFAVTRCLTGWSVAGNPWWDPSSGDGSFLFRSTWHDTSAKTVLGVPIPAGQGIEDGYAVMDIVAAHPATGRHIAWKLCKRLIGDQPPQSVVNAAAAVFAEQKDAPDQLAQVVRTILLSDEFKTTWGAKVKRPFELVVGALRAGGAEISFSQAAPETGSFLWLYYNTGQELFSWPAPNGYPDANGAWLSSGPLVKSWRLVNWLADLTDDTEAYLMDVYAQTPVDVRSANAIADFWIDRVFGRPLDPTARQEIVEFMAQGHNPDFDLPVDTDDDTKTRLQAMLGLLFMSPEFLWR